MLKGKKNVTVKKRHKKSIKEVKSIETTISHGDACTFLCRVQNRCTPPCIPKITYKVIQCHSLIWILQVIL